MKKICYFVIAAVAMIAASCSGKTSAPVDESAAITVDSLLAAAPTLVDSLVTVEGVCTHTCKHGATKIFLVGTDNSKVIRAEAGSLGSFDPEVVNSLVSVTGRLRETRIDNAYLDDWEQRLRDNGYTGEGEAGCETERAARGVDSTNAFAQIDEYRSLINASVEADGNPWLSFYHLDAVEYTIK